MEPEELDFQEATGNSGATFERLYQRAALVIWPRSHRAAVLSQGGPEVSVPFLGELVRRWQEAGADPQSVLRQEARLLAAQIRADWPESESARRHASTSGLMAGLLSHVTGLQDRKAMTALINERVVSGAYGASDNAGLITALGALPRARAQGLIQAIIDAHAKTQPVACVDLLARAVAAFGIAPDSESGAGSGAGLHASAQTLICALPAASAPARVQSWSCADPAVEPTPAMVADLLRTLECIDPALARRAFEHILRHPQRYDIDAILLPAALNLDATDGARDLASAQALRGLVLAHLRERIAEPLEPPSDWQRPNNVTCTCADCQELGVFLADATRPEWAFRAAQSRRTHIEFSIRADRCDLNLVTVRSGSPHTLRCTKNQASYRRRVVQRQSDLEHLARLGDMT